MRKFLLGLLVLALAGLWVSPVQVMAKGSSGHSTSKASHKGKKSKKKSGKKSKGKKNSSKDKSSAGSDNTSVGTIQNKDVEFDTKAAK